MHFFYVFLVNRYLARPALISPAGLSFPVVRRRWQLGGVRHRRTGEALVRRRLRVDAQWHLTIHQLIHDELV